jgi:hypothetical protein
MMMPRIFNLVYGPHRDQGVDHMSVPFDEIGPLTVRREVKSRGRKTLGEIDEFLTVSCQYLDVGIIGFLDFANNNLLQFTATGFEVKVGL